MGESENTQRRKMYMLGLNNIIHRSKVKIKILKVKDVMKQTVKIKRLKIAITIWRLEETKKIIFFCNLLKILTMTLRFTQVQKIYF